MRFVGKYGFWLLIGMLSLVSCRQDYQSNVPDYPVNLDIDIEREYPHFVPSAPCQSLVFDHKRYERDYIGYAGVVVWININGEYRAADLCCPKCLNRTKPIQMHGKDDMFPECPICGEVFDLTLEGFPTKGIADQPLKRYDVSYSGRVLHIRH